MLSMQNSVQMTRHAKGDPGWNVIIKDACKSQPVCATWAAVLAGYVRGCGGDGTLLDDFDTCTKAGVIRHASLECQASNGCFEAGLFVRRSNRKGDRQHPSAAAAARVALPPGDHVDL